jgi:hypothetical protein
MRREDYVFCIGFEGSAAIVDGRLRARYRSYSTRQLAEHGLFKQAICSALHAGRAEELQDVCTLYNERTTHPVSSVEELMRMYGTFGIPEGVTKTIII